MAGLPLVTNIQTTAREDVILVSWKAPVQPVSGYVIDYTHNGNQYRWEETKYTNATLFGKPDTKWLMEIRRKDEWMVNYTERAM